MIRLAPLRRRLALWLCPDLAQNASPAYWSDDPISLPIWAGKIGPDWWQNAELRVYLTQTHRRVKQVEAQSEAMRRFGDLAPSKSALHRYWQRLDAFLAAGAIPHPPPPKGAAMMAENLIPAGVVKARAACSTLTDAQRMSFAIELVRDVTDEHCVLQLSRMATMATETAHELAKARFERRCA